jgi:hypothetical protein
MQENTMYTLRQILELMVEDGYTVVQISEDMYEINGKVYDEAYIRNNYWSI